MSWEAVPLSSSLILEWLAVANREAPDVPLARVTLRAPPLGILRRHQMKYIIPSASSGSPVSSEEPRRHSGDMRVAWLNGQWLL